MKKKNWFVKTGPAVICEVCWKQWSERDSLPEALLLIIMEEHEQDCWSRRGINPKKEQDESKTPTKNPNPQQCWEQSPELLNNLHPWRSVKKGHRLSTRSRHPTICQWDLSQEPLPAEGWTLPGAILCGSRAGSHSSMSSWVQRPCHPWKTLFPLIIYSCLLSQVCVCVT